MLPVENDKVYPSSKILVTEKVASRIRQKDASLFDFSDDACTCAHDYMGWADLAINPPYPLDEIQKFADEQISSGLETIILIGQGGSTQAPMTITKYNKPDSHAARFKTLDSDSPVRLRQILHDVDPKTTLVLVSSKSGGTIEPRSALCAVWPLFEKVLGADTAKHFVAITDPGSNLEKRAEREGWLKVFLGEPSVGGRFSALSVFGLVPAALAGIDVKKFVAKAADAEERCSEDAIDNPALALAAFLYDNYKTGRNKFAFLTQKRGRVLGLWIEQLLAESTGKSGQGILPNIEVDPLLLSHDPGDRTVVMYQTATDLWDELKNFEMSLSYVDPLIPRVSYGIETVYDLGEHFVMWEYATAMVGFLMKVCPFDQPDVASAKAAVLDIIDGGEPAPDIVATFIGDTDMGQAEVRMAPMFRHCTTIEGALTALFESVEPGDYVATNAFLPFTGEGRREALETIRHSIAKYLGVASCLEVGPRYLHSMGQLQKGGPDKGVFLILSADEMKDIDLVDGPVASMAQLAKAQAEGDLVTLAARGRRCIHLHLPDNTGVTLRALADTVVEIVRRLESERLEEE